jgi:peptidoglycan/LPS O-acetylase OafA/YrhL
MLALGLAVYVRFRTRRHPVRTGRLAVVGVLLVAIYVVALVAPPPPGMTVVAVSDIVCILLAAVLAAWADRQASSAELAAAAHAVR